jgi:peptidoglycan/LPS O-acetylase OafA/YrhL
MFSLDRSKNDTSGLLDLLRAVAAQMVCVGHGISFFVSDWRPTRLPYMQNVGVLLFFLISGFLITYTLIERSKNPAYSFPQFFIERFSRIYSGLIPALAIVAIIDGVTVYLTGDPLISRYFTLKTLIANIFMLEGYRGIFPNALQWSAFGSASPLWTLGIEWQIYLFVASSFFMAVRPKSIIFLIPIALFFGQTPIHFLFGAFQPDGVGKGLFLLWLGGSLVYLVMRSSVMRPFPAIAICVCGALGFTLFAHAGAEYDLKLYPFLIAAFFGLVAVTQSTHVLTSPKLVKSISFFADYSFSLYLVHHTIMYAMWTISPSRGLAVFAVAVLTSNLVAIGLAEIGEKNHRKIARAMNQKILPGESCRNLSLALLSRDPPVDD